MRHHRTQAGSDEHRRLERAIVELLSENHDERWPRDEFAASLRVDRRLSMLPSSACAPRVSCCSTAGTCSPRRARGGSIRLS
jgi:hypothetical protein